MNDPALKGRGIREKMLMPKTLGRRNVMLNGFSSYISNAPKEFSWTPEMSFSKVSSQPRINSKQSVSAISFEELKCSGNAHGMRHFNKQVNMVWLHTKLINFKSMLVGNFLEKFFARYSDFVKLKWIPSILGFPHKVERVLSHTMSEMVQFHFSCSCAKFKNIANTITNVVIECANSIAHFFYFSKNLRRFGLPRAEALGIL